MKELKELLSMHEVATAAGISYDTLLTFLRKYGDRIPSMKQGGRRLLPPRAIEAVREITRENKGRQGRGLRRRTREKAASDKAEVLIEKAMMRLDEAAALLKAAFRSLSNDRGGTVLSIQTLHPNTFRFRHPVDVLIEYDGPMFAARLLEVDLSASGDTRKEAVNNLRAIIGETYLDLLRTERDLWTEELRARAALLELVRKSS